MNIFITNECPIKSAQYLDDKRVIKMILESCQILSTAIFVHSQQTILKPTHINHPVCIWARETRANYLWLFEHTKALCNEFFIRRNKNHKYVNLLDTLYKNVCNIPEGNLTPFVNCAANKSLGLDFKHLEVTEAYKLYLSERWKNDKLTPKKYGKEFLL